MTFLQLVSTLLLSTLPIALTFPSGAPSVSCGYGLTNQGGVSTPVPIPQADTVYGVANATTYPRSSAGIHFGYPSGSQNITVTITSGGTAITAYVPGQTYNVSVTYVQPVVPNLDFGFEGFIMGANLAPGSSSTGGGGPLSFVSGTLINNGGIISPSYAQTLKCPSVDDHITHTVGLFSSAQNLNLGGRTLQALWTAPSTNKGPIAVQVGLITGVTGDAYLGGLATVTVPCAPTSNGLKEKVNWNLFMFALVATMFTFTY